MKTVKILIVFTAIFLNAVITLGVIKSDRFELLKGGIAYFYRGPETLQKPWPIPKGIHLPPGIPAYLKIQQHDFKMIKELGFKTVRLPLDPLFLWDGNVQGTLKSNALEFTLGTVKAALTAGLGVIVDMHGYQDQLAKNDPTIINAFAAFWGNLAKEVASASDAPNRVFFEVLNEPHTHNHAAWQEMQGKFIAAIRSSAPEYTILATGADWSDPYGLIGDNWSNPNKPIPYLTPYADQNIAYIFHWYYPYIFTSQGVSYMGPDYSVLHGVLYPTNKNNVDALIQSYTASGQLGTVKLLEQYKNENWNKSLIQQKLQPVFEWAKQHHVSVLCGEFGAVVGNPPTNINSRAQWYNDSVSVFTNFGFGWNAWNFNEGFGGFFSKNVEGYYVPNFEMLQKAFRPYLPIPNQIP